MSLLTIPLAKHEFTHYTSCKILGLEGKIEINLLVDPPIYSMNCGGINEKSSFSKFLFWGSPYLVSLIIMILFLFYLDKRKFYLIGLPFGVALNDSMNIFGLYEWTHKTGNLGNDILNILFKTPKGYFYLISIILGLTISLLVFNLISFYKESIKNYSRRGLSNNVNNPTSPKNL